jgi:ABC-type multidrug transport system fused ATPase/permease subunit
MKHVLYFARQIHLYSGNILYLNLLGMMLISLFEGVGIFLLIPLLSFTELVNMDQEENSPILRVIHMFQGIPETQGLIIILGIFIILMVGQSLFQRTQMILNVKIQQGFTKHLKEETYKRILESNWGFFTRKRKSDLINLMSTELSRVSGGAHMFLQFLSSLIFTVIQIGIASLLSVKMTIFVLVFGAALIYFSRIFVKKTNSIGNEAFQLSQTYLAGITDHFNGIKDIKTNSLEESHISWFNSICKRMEFNMVELIKIKTTSLLIYKVVSALLIVTFIFLSIKMFQAQPAQLMLIIIIFSRLWPRFIGIQSNLEQLGSVIPSFKALIDLQNECLVSKEIYNDKYQNIAPLQLKNGIECKSVFFRYNPSHPLSTLQNINLTIPANHMTSIVGPSGAGKSTLVDLLMGLNQPEIGEVLIDGASLGEGNLLSLRRSVSYIPQDPFLFNASVRENLQLIKPDASDYEIWEALEFSAAADFVRQLPSGLDTLIGDRGVRLSGGERQRIVLARAILRKPSILVLDEATSALDTENEVKIQEALERLKGKMTIIVIAHRLSTIRNADQILVLDQGKIIQKGDFNQLANEKRGMFSNLLGKQVETAQYNFN